MKFFKSPLPDITIPEVTIPDLMLQRQKNFKKPLCESIAIVDGSTHKGYTYTQFNERVNKCAQGLSQRGIKKGDIIAIVLPNCTEYPIIFLGSLKIGAIVTTANPLSTKKELEFQFKDAKAKLIVTIPSVKETANYLKEKIETIKEVIIIGEESYSSLFNNDGTQIPSVSIDVKNDPAVLPYSSGTTGLIKGVVLTHYNIVSNILQYLAAEYEMANDENPTLMGVLPFFHIYGMTVMMLSSLVIGAKMVTLPRFDFVQFLETIQNYKINFLHVVPPMILALAKQPIVEKYDLSSLKVIISGAAPLGGELQKIAAQRLKCTVKQGYGMTEMSPVSHLNLSSEIKMGSVGTLLPNMEARIVDSDSKIITTPYVQGELLLKGPNIMKEYLNNPEATASIFTEDGFLRTGDVAHFDEDGHYYIVDRVKELIKYKGFQVPPAEIEAVLNSHPKIADSAVIGVPDEVAGELPKAFIVLKAEQNLSEQEIHAFVAERVSPYKKLRGGIEFVDQIPKSSSGKILRRVLKEKYCK